MFGVLAAAVAIVLAKLSTAFIAGFMCVCVCVCAFRSVCVTG